MTDETVILTSNGNNDSTERYYSEMESARNVSMDAYFGARPQLLKTHAEQALYRAGFERAFQHLWNKAHGSETLPVERSAVSDARLQTMIDKPSGRDRHAALLELQRWRAGASQKAKVVLPTCAHGATSEEVCPECMGLPSDNPDEEIS